MSTDNRTEKWIESFGVGWQYLDGVPLKCIDIRRSLANQARPEALDKDLVLEYAIAMLDGDDFPAIVVYQLPERTGLGLFVVIDGNHRVHAMQEAKRDKIDAYLVLSDNLFVVKQMTYVANSMGAKRTTATQRLAQALKLISDHGMQATAAARLLRVSIEAVREGMYQVAARERAVKLGINVNGLAATSLVELGRIQNDTAFNAAVRVAVDHNLATDSTTRLSQAVRSQRTEINQLQAVQEFAVQLPAATPSGKPTIKIPLPICRDFFRYGRRFVEVVETRPMPSQLQLTTRRDIESAIKMAERLEAWAKRFKVDAEYELNR